MLSFLIFLVAWKPSRWALTQISLRSNPNHHFSKVFLAGVVSECGRRFLKGKGPIDDRAHAIYGHGADTRSINFGLTTWEKTLKPVRTYYLLVRNNVSIQSGQVNVSTDVIELFPFHARQLLRLMKRVRPSSWSTPGPVSA
jgi:hypothetical protein